jgi:hypothetical protein
LRLRLTKKKKRQKTGCDIKAQNQHNSSKFIAAECFRSCVVLTEEARILDEKFEENKWQTCPAARPAASQYAG